MALKHGFQCGFFLFMAFGVPPVQTDEQQKALQSQRFFLCHSHVLILELQLELVGNQCDKLRIGGFALGVRHRVAEEPLERFEVTPVPGDFDGMADGALDSGRRGREGLGNLRVQNLRNGVSLPDGKQGGLTSAAEKQGCV